MKIWFDIATPKYGLFFSYLIPHLKNWGHEIIITTRSAVNYTEAKAVLDMQKLEYHDIGMYGGGSVYDKFVARLDRQKSFLKLFEKTGYPDCVICGAVPDSAQTGFGLGIPVFLFSDTPLRADHFDFNEITLGTRLTHPLASKIFYPFIIPKNIYSKMGIDPKKCIEYDFIDVYLWMKDLKKDSSKDFRKKYKLQSDKPTLLIREEEFKAHYVFEKLNVIYQLIEELSDKIDANLVIMPRYETEELKRNFSNRALILEDKIRPEEFYPFIDLMIGGGGTMNLEAACYGIPVLSMRSFLLFHDRYLIDNGMMFWTHDIKEASKWVKESIGKRLNNFSFFSKGRDSAETISHQIHEFLCALDCKSSTPNSKS